MLTKIHLFFMSKHSFIKNNKILIQFISFDLKFKSIHETIALCGTRCVIFDIQAWSFT